MRYEIDIYKTENLTPDEQNAKRHGAKGVWLRWHDCEADSPREALRIVRERTGYDCRIAKH